ncbi:HIT family protein [Bacillus sp. NEB1478]|uniref:HIT family protein n=1 Tax=Bacillus sp. NEB1478 TaxID=3073816 RepID=UPI002873639F|nr:HIT family protein [Bacillus sp. NEB1478]WNB93514.1 HIT family protein [Bacillus sp. NEB1478]
MECLGCNLANKNESVYVVYENNYVCCFLDHDPYNDGHVLILPKKHFKEAADLDESTADSIMKASILISKAVQKMFNPDGITICQNGGIFDELTHYHMHVVPRYKNQSFSTFYLENESGSITEKTDLTVIKTKLRDAISEITK